ncbi:MAG: chemotaxis protein CheW [Ignavibacteria bacterium]
MADARAILIEYAAGRCAAIAFADMVEVLQAPTSVPVPLAPAHCDALLGWHDDWLPIFDLAAWQGAPAQGDAGFCAVVRYRDAAGARRHGALRCLAFPRIAEVDDANAAPLPDAVWRGFARACFREAGEAVPVLSLAALFGTSPQGGAAQDESGGIAGGMLEYGLV